MFQILYWIHGFVCSFLFFHDMFLKHSLSIIKVQAKTILMTPMLNINFHIHSHSIPGMVPVLAILPVTSTNAKPSTMDMLNAFMVSVSPTATNQHAKQNTMGMLNVSKVNVFPTVLNQSAEPNTMVMLNVSIGYVSLTVTNQHAKPNTMGMQNVSMGNVSLTATNQHAKPNTMGMQNVSMGNVSLIAIPLPVHWNMECVRREYVYQHVTNMPVLQRAVNASKEYVR